MKRIVMSYPIVWPVMGSRLYLNGPMVVRESYFPETKSRENCITFPKRPRDITNKGTKQTESIRVSGKCFFDIQYV